MLTIRSIKAFGFLTMCFYRLRSNLRTFEIEKNDERKLTQKLVRHFPVMLIQFLQSIIVNVL